MRIGDYLGTLGRRKWIVALVIATAAMVAGIGSYLVTPVYSASAVVRLTQIQDSPITYYTLNYTERVANTSVHLLTSGPFLERAAQRMGLPAAPANLSQSIRAEALANTELIRITVEHTDPVFAARLANTLALLLIESGEGAYVGGGRGPTGILREQLDAAEAALHDARAHLESMISAGTTDAEPTGRQDQELRVRMREDALAALQAALTNATLRGAMLADSISVIDWASPPSRPISPRPMINLALALVLGVVGGTGLAFLVDNLDRRILSTDRLAAIGGLSVMGVIPRIPVPWRARREPVLLNGDERPSATEAFRMIRSILMSGALGPVPRTLLITSAEPRAGRSTLVANLAVALARTGCSVIAIDSDLRRPSLHRVFGIRNDAGFSNGVLAPDSARSLPRQTKVPGLRILTSGTLLHYPPELLASPNVAVLLRNLADAADVVLLDSPPVLEVTDAITLAPMVGGVLLVASQGVVTDRQVQRALEHLRSVGAMVLGTVLNRARPADEEYGLYRHEIVPWLDLRLGRALAGTPPNKSQADHATGDIESPS